MAMAVVVTAGFIAITNSVVNLASAAAVVVIVDNDNDNNNYNNNASHIVNKYSVKMAGWKRESNHIFNRPILYLHEQLHSTPIYLFALLILRLVPHYVNDIGAR